MPGELATTSKKYFPILEPKEIALQKLTIGPSAPQVEKADTIREWHLWGKEREKHLVITQFFMFIEFTRYSTFEDFGAHFTTLVDSLFDVSKELRVRRLGLRYINNIELAGRNSFSWSTYLNRNLLSIFKLSQDKAKIARAFHNLELNLGDYTLRFQYGMPNPDYPAPIRKRIFVLDYDAYSVGVLTKDEIRQSLPVLHDEIESMFESCITDKLRGMMNVSG